MKVCPCKAPAPYKRPSETWICMLCGLPSAADRSAEAAPVSRWIDPCTGRVWGSPNSRQLVDLALQAAQDEQEERAKHLTREEAWRHRERILEL